MSSLKPVSVLAVLGLAAAALVLVGTPAQAQGQGVGAGRAVIHIDAPTAVVEKTGRRSYRVVLPLDASGQWMGERRDGKGRERARIGDLTAQKLSAKWKQFRYTSRGAVTTLAWSERGMPMSALVRLSRPKVVDGGVRFDFRSRAHIPATLQDMSFNLRRAPSKHASREDTDVIVSIIDDLAVEVEVETISYISTRIFNRTNDNTCWTGDGAKVIEQGSTANTFVSVTSNTCDNISYQNQMPASGSDSAYGVKVQWVDGSTQGFLTYYLTINLNDGSDPYPWTDQVVTFPTSDR